MTRTPVVLTVGVRKLLSVGMMVRVDVRDVVAPAVRDDVLDAVVTAVSVDDGDAVDETASEAASVAESEAPLLSGGEGVAVDEPVLDGEAVGEALRVVSSKAAVDEGVACIGRNGT